MYSTAQLIRPKGSLYRSFSNRNRILSIRRRRVLVWRVLLVVSLEKVNLEKTSSGKYRYRAEYSSFRNRAQSPLRMAYIRTPVYTPACCWMARYRKFLFLKNRLPVRSGVSQAAKMAWPAESGARISRPSLKLRVERLLV